MGLTIVIKISFDYILFSYQGLPEDYMTKDFNGDDLPSAIDLLCVKHDGKYVHTFTTLLVK